MFNTQKVAEVIRSARIKKNLTQMELADKMADIDCVADWCNFVDIYS